MFSFEPWALKVKRTQGLIRKGFVNDEQRHSCRALIVENRKQKLETSHEWDENFSNRMLHSAGLRRSVKAKIEEATTK